MGEPTMVQQRMLKSFHSALNIPEPEMDELEHLKKENERLKTQMRTSGLTITREDSHHSLDPEAHANKCLMRLIIRFEIRDRKGHSGVSLDDFKCSSFDIDDNGD